MEHRTRSAITTPSSLPPLQRSAIQFFKSVIQCESRRIAALQSESLAFGNVRLLSGDGSLPEETRQGGSASVSVQPATHRLNHMTQSCRPLPESHIHLGMAMAHLVWEKSRMRGRYTEDEHWNTPRYEKCASYTN